MTLLKIAAVLVLSYLVGSVPIGLLIVKAVKGVDLRNVQSGRVGGTNAMRAAGFWVGFATALLDVLKGAAGVWLAAAIFPDSTWLKVIAPLFVIVGHNYSIFLLQRVEGKFQFGGGAGGAPCLGGAVGLWPYSFLIIFPLAFGILFGIGYASVATMSIPILSSLIFAILAVFFDFPWEYIVYGILAEALLVWALRPNIRRLMNGTERLVGWRAKRVKTREKQSA